MAQAQTPSQPPAHHNKHHLPQLGVWTRGAGLTYTPGAPPRPWVPLPPCSPPGLGSPYPLRPPPGPGTPYPLGSPPFPWTPYPLESPPCPWTPYPLGTPPVPGSPHPLGSPPTPLRLPSTPLGASPRPARSTSRPSQSTPRWAATMPGSQPSQRPPPCVPDQHNAFTNSLLNVDKMVLNARVMVVSGSWCTLSPGDFIQGGEEHQQMG